MSSHKKPIRVLELETLGVLAAFFLILSILTHRQPLAWMALALLLTGLFVKPLAELIAKWWLKFAEVVGTFNGRLILTLTFYLFLTPLAFLYRRFVRNPLMLKREGAPSFYTVRDHTYSGADLEKMW